MHLFVHIIGKLPCMCVWQEEKEVQMCVVVFWGCVCLGVLLAFLFVCFKLTGICIFLVTIMQNTKTRIL